MSRTVRETLETAALVVTLLGAATLGGYLFERAASAGNLRVAQAATLVDLARELEEREDPTLTIHAAASIGDAAASFLTLTMASIGRGIRTELQPAGNWPLPRARTARQCLGDPLFSEPDLALTEVTDNELERLLIGWHAAATAIRTLSWDAVERALVGLMRGDQDSGLVSIFLLMLDELGPEIRHGSELRKVVEKAVIDTELEPFVRGAAVSVLAHAGIDQIWIRNDLGLDLSCRRLPPVTLRGTGSATDAPPLENVFPLTLRKTEFAPGSWLRSLSFRRVVFDHTILSGVVVTGSTFTYSPQSDGHPSSRPILASGALFRQTVFQVVDLAGSHFVGAHLEDVLFEGTALGRAVFDQSGLERVQFVGAALAGASFRQVWLGSMTFEDTNLTGAVLRPREAGARRTLTIAGRRLSQRSLGCEGVGPPGSAICRDTRR